MSDSVVSGWGLEPSIASLVLGRRVSMFMLGIAILTFGSRNLQASKIRQIICLSLCITMFGLSCMGTYEFLNNNVNASIMVPIVLEIILVLLFGIVIIKDRKVEFNN